MNLNPSKAFKNPNSCEFCGSLFIEISRINLNLEYLICNSCGHCLKVSSIDLKDDFHNAQLTYFGDDSILLQPEPSVFDKEILAQRRLITRRFLPPKGSVLEVGPGIRLFC